MVKHRVRFCRAYVINDVIVCLLLLTGQIHMHVKAVHRTMTFKPRNGFPQYSEKHVLQHAQVGMLTCMCAAV